MNKYYYQNYYYITKKIVKRIKLLNTRKINVAFPQFVNLNKREIMNYKYVS